MATKHIPQGNRKGFATFAGSGAISKNTAKGQETQPSAFAKATSEVPKHDEKTVADSDKDRIVKDNKINAETKDLPPGLTDENKVEVVNNKEQHPPITVTGMTNADGSPFKTTGDADNPPANKPTDDDKKTSTPNNDS